MAMNSMEEDALFEEWGWWKDLIGRKFVSPGGHFITFDQVMDVSTSEEGEQQLIVAIREYGEKA